MTDIKSLIERLRECAKYRQGSRSLEEYLEAKAADALSSLQSQVEELEAENEPMVRALTAIAVHSPDDADAQIARNGLPDRVIDCLYKSEMLPRTKDKDDG